MQLGKIKQSLAPAAYAFFGMLGRYKDFSRTERSFSRREPVTFQGDIPPMAGTEFNQYRVKYDTQRAVFGRAKNVLYTRNGMGWIDGRLERRLSFQEVNLNHLLAKPKDASRHLPRGTILQAQTPKTFGDWMSEHVVSLSLAVNSNAIVEPLLLPQHWFEKTYVQRDLKRLKIEAVGIDETVKVDDVVVLGKTRPSHYWTREEADAVVKALGIERLPVEPGRALYLSRHGERGEGPQREIDNLMTEAAMRAAGVRVVRTVETGLEDYLAMAADAETIFADHGSAMYNMLYWDSKRVVEFYPPSYWDGAFLQLADALGINDYHLWMIGPDVTVESLAQRAQGLLQTRPVHPRS